MTRTWTHIPILAPEIAQLLLQRLDGVYVDGTLGLGGHTRFFLSRLGPQARVIGFDKDEEALAMARERVNDTRLTAVHASYTQAPQILADLGLDGADGALFDLGLSSYQLDNPARGFSLQHDGPLDMRFDLSAPLTAEKIVNEWGLDDLERILTQYGEERNAHAIALALMAARRQGPIRTTFALKNIVQSVLRGRGKIHPATQTFQALRIAVNDELGCVERVAALLPKLLRPGGRAAVLTFHSLEDRLVKTRFKELCALGGWQLVNKHVIAPGYEEVRQNPRARSAKLRVIEKI
ncbi:16S rRNA (cytosine(1402)-N(4))-methyltransferase RsmH [Candidatus Avelusimicrobium facis]|uniref:16S rRNA (cytosine(1402)-N(4))-methyltransferase RsmH n=1 Tax=Candidatus Avelusimicrobium facis TaxID=3416203 RepID=UPI003D13868D